MKYAVLLVALMFAGCGGGSSTVGYIIHIDGSPILVAKEDIPEDFPEGSSWDDAMAACQNLGNGWRLPSSEEYAAMYEQLHTKGKGNFSTEGLYWSSSKDSYSALYFNFVEGKASSNSNYSFRPFDSDYDKYHARHVRAVRTLP